MKDSDTISPAEMQAYNRMQAAIDEELVRIGAVMPPVSARSSDVPAASPNVPARPDTEAVAPRVRR